jgi:hypothetical protein
LRPFGSKPLLISPDGSRYALLVTQGDLERGGNWLEILSGRLGSADEAAHPKTVRLFTTAVHSADDGRLPVLVNNRPVWLSDSRHIALLWSDGTEPTQVISIDLESGSIRHLTHHATSVITFGISSDGQALIYSAYPPRREDPDRARWNGYVVAKKDALSLLLEGPGETAERWISLETYVKTGTSDPRRVISDDRPSLYDWPDNFSPDGRYVIVEGRQTRSEPTEWDAYRSPALQTVLARTRADHARGDLTPNTGDSWHARQVVVYDLVYAAMRPVMNAPIAPGPAPAVIWEPDSRHIIVGPAFLPVAHAGEAGLSGRALVEVDVQTGEYKEIGAPDGTDGYRPTRLRDGVLEVSNGTRELQFRKSGSRWKVETARGSAGNSSVGHGSLTVELRENMNTPPVLYAIDRDTKSEIALFKIDPNLDGFELSHVEIVNWHDRDGRQWTG